MSGLQNEGSLRSPFSTIFPTNGQEISNLPHFNVTIKLETKFFNNGLENLQDQITVNLHNQ